MSVQIALNFLKQARHDELIQAELQDIIASPTGDDGSTEKQRTDTTPLVALGAKHGFNFTASELQTAFRHDWKLRWLHFQAHQPKST